MKEKIAIDAVLAAYQALRDNESGIGETSRGNTAAYSQVVADCIELTIMAEYRKASKRKQREYLHRAIDCYKASWPLDDPFSIAAHSAMVTAAERLEQVTL